MHSTIDIEKKIMTLYALVRYTSCGKARTTLHLTVYIVRAPHDRTRTYVSKFYGNIISIVNQNNHVGDIIGNDFTTGNLYLCSIQI